MSLRQVFLVIKRNAGHSKWQNIRHIKGEKDQQRSMLFVKLAQRIKIAIQENGNNINPALNVQLANAIEYAKSNDMPVSSIQNVIKSTQVNKDAAQICRFSIRGPKGSILLVTGLTNKAKNLQYEIACRLKRVGGNLAEMSLESQFHKKGVVVALPPPNIENIEEISVEHAIEAGAEEVSPPDDNKKLTFTCEMKDLHNVKTKLQELNYRVEDSKITFLPKLQVSLNEDEMELMGNIIAKLEEMPEVTEVYDNIA